MKTTGKRIFRFVPAASLVLFALAAVSGGIHAAAVWNTGFADWFNRNVSAVFRAGLAHLTGVLPFSLAECLVILLLPAVVCLLIWGIRRCAATQGHTCRFMTGILSVLAAVYTLFVLTFAAGYQGETLEKKLALEPTEVTADNLYDTTVTVIRQLNALCGQISFLYGQGSLMPASFDGMTGELNDAYAALCGQYAFVQPLSSRPKLITLSKPMTYTHISGVYSFFTGEANVNVNYPDFVIPFTTAHEMAHQRGIAREDEANFIAFLVCAGAEDPYIRYSGYLNLYQYLDSALYQASPSLWRKERQMVDSRITEELSAYSVFFRPYQDSVASQVTDKVNDAYLSSQGTPGTVSYDLVVELAVAYYSSVSYTVTGAVPGGNG